MIVLRKQQRRILLFRLLTGLVLWATSSLAFTPSSCTSYRLSLSSPSSSLLQALTPRELEIRRKIRELKQARRRKSGDDELEDDDDDDDMLEYTTKIRKKLGSTKSRMLLGITGPTMEEEEGEDVENPTILGQLGALPNSEDPDDNERTSSGAYTPPSPQKRDDSGSPVVTSGTRVEDDMQDEDDELAQEERLVELVAERLQEKVRTSQVAMATSGVGGSWSAPTKEVDQEDVYQPKTGSWGAFPRPRDISKAYGGGRRVGPGYSNEQERAKSIEETRAKLQEYRRRVGIEVESEKINAEAIQEAQDIASVAMQRGMYATAVSSLEKVTQYCSTNSKVGGKVFLELAMAYEAIGRTGEAISVYQTLTKSRLEETKNNAKRLLYGIEAMQFMRDNVSASEFSRARAKTTFIDTTGLGDIASKFDDVYETAYVDLDNGFYKKLTQSVVRSVREARQVLLKATGPGEVERRRIVQALRSVSRGFTDALQKEIDAKTVPETPIAVIDGKPIIPYSIKQAQSSTPLSEDFNLMDSAQMLDNLGGEWRLQLIADKQGDGVKFFNTTIAWQVIDKTTMNFEALCPQGFFNVEQAGQLRFSPKRRILRRGSISASGAIIFADIFAPKQGAVGAVRAERQVLVVDSTLLITRGVPKRRNNSDDEKDYFAVWRRVEPGTYSGQR